MCGSLRSPRASCLVPVCLLPSDPFSRKRVSLKHSTVVMIVFERPHPGHWKALRQIDASIETGRKSDSSAILNLGSGLPHPSSINNHKLTALLEELFQREEYPKATGWFDLLLFRFGWSTGQQSPDTNALHSPLSRPLREREKNPARAL